MGFLFTHTLDFILYNLVCTAETMPFKMLFGPSTDCSAMLSLKAKRHTCVYYAKTLLWIESHHCDALWEMLFQASAWPLKYWVIAYFTFLPPLQSQRQYRWPQSFPICCASETWNASCAFSIKTLWMAYYLCLVIMPSIFRQMNKTGEMILYFEIRVCFWPYLIAEW